MPLPVFFRVISAVAVVWVFSAVPARCLAAEDQASRRDFFSGAVRLVIPEGFVVSQDTKAGFAYRQVSSVFIHDGHARDYVSLTLSRHGNDYTLRQVLEYDPDDPAPYFNEGMDEWVLDEDYPGKPGVRTRQTFRSARRVVDLLGYAAVRHTAREVWKESGETGKEHLEYTLPVKGGDLDIAFSSDGDVTGLAEKFLASLEITPKAGAFPIGVAGSSWRSPEGVAAASGHALNDGFARLEFAAGMFSLDIPEQWKVYSNGENAWAAVAPGRRRKVELEYLKRFHREYMEIIQAWGLDNDHEAFRKSVRYDDLGGSATRIELSGYSVFARNGYAGTRQRMTLYDGGNTLLDDHLLLAVPVEGGCITLSFDSEDVLDGEWEQGMTAVAERIFASLRISPEAKPCPPEKIGTRKMSWFPAKELAGLVLMVGVLAIIVTMFVRAFRSAVGGR